ncbi:MAG: hypothetical protein FWE62_02210 [Firmicutes bacterium]|nr:hypothetical protein [Bacillota bacterium]
MSAKKLCLLAVLTAFLTGGKLALAFIPNVEIVTLLLIVYALTLRRSEALAVCAVFIMIEILIWGFNPWWIVLYFIYWPSLVLTVSLLPKSRPVQTLNMKNAGLAKVLPRRVIFAIVIGVIFTALFGVLSTFIEIIFMGGLGTGRFWTYYYFRYVAGIAFFVTHVASNAVILPLLVPVLYRTMNTFLKSSSFSARI